MSVIQGVITECPRIQDRLNNAWQFSTGILPDEVAPLGTYLVSPSNTQLVTRQIIPGGGKVRTARYTYWQRDLESTVKSNQPNPACGVGEDPQDAYQDYTLDTSINLQSQGISLTAEQLEGVCDPNSGILEQVIMKDMSGLRRRVSSEITAQACALFGTWGSGLFTAGNDPGEVTAQDEYVLRTTLPNGEISKRAHTRLFNALEDIGYNRSALIFGGGTMREFYQLYQAGCCSNEGLDLAELMAQFGFAFAYDKRVASELTNNGALVIAPGALQVLQYGRASWTNGMRPEVFDTANYLHREIIDPATGYLYDWTMQHDCGTITSNLTWTGKTIGLPADMFASGDDYEGVTYVNKVLVNNCDEPECAE